MAILKNRFKDTLSKILIFILVFVWVFGGWPPILKNPELPPRPPAALALNLVNNFNFATDATGWSSTTDDGTNVCGSTTSSVADTAPASAGYNDSLGNSAGSFVQVGDTGKAIKDRSMAYQTITAPGSGEVKAKGQFDYYGNSTAWNATADTSWVRLDIYDSTNANFVDNIGCASFNSNQSWTTTSLSSDIVLTGSTTYTVRVTFRSVNLNTAGSAAVTLGADNVIVTFAPVGLSASAVAGSTNVSLSWPASTGGTGANGLHATNPYKVYRNTTSPVTTANFLANGTTNSYTDSSTAGNTTYYYAVTNVDTASIESPTSTQASVLTNPGQPGTLSFSNVTNGAMRVTWSAPTGGATSYKVERCSGSGCTNFSQITSGETNTYYDDSGLSASTLYRYQVRATNASGDGAYSAIGEQTTSSASGAFDVYASSSASFNSALPVIFTAQTSTMTSVGGMKIIDDRGTSAGWTLNLTGSDWRASTEQIQFNYNGKGSDNGKGKLCAFPNGGSLYAESGSLTGVSKGGIDCFSSTLSTIDLVTATNGNGNGTYWLTDMKLEQYVPANATATVYTTSIIFTLQ